MRPPRRGARPARAGRGGPRPGLRPWVGSGRPRGRRRTTSRPATDGAGRPRPASRSISSTNRGLPSASASIRASRAAGRWAPPSRPPIRRSVASGRQRFELERARVAQPAGPVGPPDQEVGARGTQQQDGRLLRGIRDMLDHVEQHRLRPVEIVERDDQRPGHRQGPRTGCERSAAGRPGSRFVRRRRSPGRSAPRSDRRRGWPATTVASRASIASGGSSSAMPARRKDDLAEGPEGDPVAVGEAAPAEGPHRRAGRRRELAR